MTARPNRRGGDVIDEEIVAEGVEEERCCEEDESEWPKLDVSEAGIEEEMLVDESDRGRGCEEKKRVLGK